jgi:hypothetical protein
MDPGKRYILGKINFTVAKMTEKEHLENLHVIGDIKIHILKKYYLIVGLGDMNINLLAHFLETYY